MCFNKRIFILGTVRHQ